MVVGIGHERYAANAGIGHERYAANAFLEGLVYERLDVHRGDARWIENEVSQGHVGSPTARVQELLVLLGARPNLHSIELINSDHRVMAAGDRSRIGERNPVAALVMTNAATGERSSAEPASFTGRSIARRIDRRIEFVVPLTIDGERFALISVQDASGLDARLDAIEREILLVGLLSLPLAIGLFFVFGGRHLTGHHAWALRQSSRDPLTGVGNHSAYQESLAVEWEASRRHGDPFVLALVDVDEFKLHNDQLGHEYGDRVLTHVAAVLADVRPTDKCFRLGGDEFAIVLPRTGTRGAQKAMERALERIAAELPGIHLSIGLAVSTAAACDGVVLREQADTAAYEAKRVEGSAIVVFDEICSATALAAPDKLVALDELIAKGRFDVAFQPIWDFERNRIFGYEALARPCQREELSGPGEAFELAAKFGRAHLLDAVARESTFARVSELPPNALLFVNVAPKTLEVDGLAGTSLVDAVQAAGLSPYQVVLEIKEHSPRRLKHVASEISRLRDLGFKIALDNVGMGNANLLLLPIVRVDFVKLDRSIVADAARDRSALGVVEAVIAFARRTDAMVIAEGIETHAQLALVKRPQLRDEDPLAGVRGGQGYLLGRPTSSFAESAPFEMTVANRAPRAAGARRATRGSDAQHASDAANAPDARPAHKSRPVLALAARSHSELA